MSTFAFADADDGVDWLADPVGDRVAVAVAVAARTVVSAPPESVTGLQAPNVPQVPAESGAEERSTTPLELSTPDPASVPLSSVTPTEAVVYQGPAVSAADWPVGAVESAEIVSESLALVPPPLKAVTFFAPGPAAPADQV